MTPPYSLGRGGPTAEVPQEAGGDRGDAALPPAESRAAVTGWMIGHGQSVIIDTTVQDHGFAVIIPTLEGMMRAEPDDWIIRGVKGEFYPIKDSIFRETYEPVE